MAELSNENISAALINEIVEVPETPELTTLIVGEIGGPKLNMEDLQKQMGELQKLMRQLVEDKANELRDKPKAQNQNKTIPTSGEISFSSDIIPLLGANILPAIREFFWDVSDRNEAERFINAIKTMATEHRWSAFRTRMVLEGKLGPKARAKYFEGLGNVETIGIEDRCVEFLKLFSRRPSNTEAEELFLNCTQEKGERVISYKLRLISLSEPYRARFINHREVYQEFLNNQFIKGLNPNLKIEVLKAGESTFEDSVIRASRVEECLELCATKPSQVMGISESDEIRSLKEQVKQLTIKVNQEEKKSYAQATKDNLYCSYCNGRGHTRNNCRQNKINTLATPTTTNTKSNELLKQLSPIPVTQGVGTDAISTHKKGSPYYCSRCDKYGHTNYSCYFNHLKSKLGINSIKNKPKINSNLKGKGEIDNNHMGKGQIHTNKTKGRTVPDTQVNQSIKTRNKFSPLVGLATNDVTSEHNKLTKNMAASQTVQSFKTKQSKTYNSKRTPINRQITSDIDNFYKNLNKTKLTNKPQIVLNYSGLIGDKPILNLELFNRPIKALCDTGAEVTVISEDVIKPYDPIIGNDKTKLLSFSGSSVDAYYTAVSLTLGNVRINQHVCVAPLNGDDQYDMIIGYDFLQRHSAINDIVNSSIRFAVDTCYPDKQILPIRTEPNYGLCCYLRNESTEDDYSTLMSLLGVDQMVMSFDHSLQFRTMLKTYQKILIEDVTKMTGAYIEPYAPTFKSDCPIYQRQFRMPHSMANALRKKLDKFEEAGIISRKASSAWNSPVLAVKKPDGDDIRMVLDLRKLNEIIEPLPYPLMRIEDIITRLGGSRIFSKLDLNNGYYNLKLKDSVKDRFSFTTPWGRYRMERLPQGCITSASIFQKVMNEALHDLIGKGQVFVFQDDIIVHTNTMDEHLEVLGELFDALYKINMATRPSKCKFFQENVNFLGHIVGKNGSKPSKENTKVIENFDRPKTVRQVRSFMGTVNFYRKFIPNITDLAAPLYNLIKKDHIKINWTDDCEVAFLTLKNSLINAPLLSYPDFSKPFTIKCDASNVGIGGVLEQETNGDFQPIAYCSRKLNKAERNYSVIEREALAIVFTLNQFRYLIYGYPVILMTDHKPLTYIFKMKDTNQRLVRWLLLIQDYQLKIEHIKGKNNFTADMLSRWEDESENTMVNQISLPKDALTSLKIKLAQDQDPVCQKYIQNIIAGLYPENDYILDEDMVLLKLVFPTRNSGWNYRVVVPCSLQSDVIFNYHDRLYSGHLSLPKVIWKIKQVFTWDNMFRDISNYIKSCEKCQKRNTIRTKAPFQPIVPPGYPMQRLNVDILGPFSTSTNSNFKYLIVYTDSLSRFVIANPIPNMEASTVAEDYVRNVFCVYGGSQELLTDKGSQFMGLIFNNICKRLGIKHIITSGYRPCSNGIAERSNQKIINILAQSCNSTYTDWHVKIPFVTHAINTSPNRSSGETPFFLLHGFDPIDPAIESSCIYRKQYTNVPEFVENTANTIELVRSEVTAHLTLSSKKNCEDKNEGRKLREFYVGQQVLYLDSTSYAGKNRKLKPRYKGPFRIVERLGIVNYRIRNVKDPSNIITTHIDKLKFFFPRFVLGDETPKERVTKKNRDREDTQAQGGINWEVVDDIFTTVDFSEDWENMTNTAPLVHLDIVDPLPSGSNSQIEDTLTLAPPVASGSSAECSSDIIVPTPQPMDISNSCNPNDLVVDTPNLASDPSPVQQPLPDRTNDRYNLRPQTKKPDRLDL